MTANWPPTTPLLQPAPVPHPDVDPDLDARIAGQPFCRWCQNEIRWSASYDIPHYVHTTAAATLACPGLATGQDVTPA